MTTGVTTEDINKLLGQFHQLEALLRPELPAKDNELWEQSLDQARQELDEHLKKWQCGFTLRPGGNNPARKPSKSKDKEIQQQYENRVTEIAEKKYYEKDPTYANAVDEAKRQTDEVLKSIDHLLLAVGEPLLQFPRVKNSLLAVDWKGHIRNYYPFLDKDNFSYQVRDTIDVLEALKSQFERQERKEVESQQYQAEIGQKATINVNISGDIQAENLQIGHDSSIQKQTVTREKKSGGVKKILKIIAAIVGFLAALVTIFHYLG
jgi:hypothetical protein